VNVSAPRMRRGRFGLKSAAPILCHVSAGQLALSRRYFSSLLGETLHNPHRGSCAEFPWKTAEVSPAIKQFTV
jgi:hypothetical protein